MEANWPVISLSSGGRGQGLPLRMALYARVGCVNVVKARRIYDIRRRWLLRVITAGAVTLFTAHIPLGHLFRAHIVIYRVAAIARGSGGALHVVFRIILGPPVRPGLNFVGTPNLVGHVPLGWQRIEIITNSLEVPLLPFAPIHEGDIIF